jgi:hypothetical protein
MISRADGGANETEAACRGRWSFAEPAAHCARFTGMPTGQFSRPRSDSTTVIAVEQCGMPDPSAVAGNLVKGLSGRDRAAIVERAFIRMLHKNAR